MHQGQGKTGISDSKVWDMSCSRTAQGTGGVPRSCGWGVTVYEREMGSVSEAQVLR